MKQTLLLVICILLTSAANATPDTARVLFLGNSYVQVNNLPDIIGQIATNMGDVLIKTDGSIGGSTLMDHSSNPTSLALIAQGGWDYVVLQEQSQTPAFPDNQVAQDCYPYARKLDSLVHISNPCAKTVFYMTWGRQNGDASNCAFFPAICTYQGMDSMLQLRYKIMAQTNHALLSPVGVAWHKVRDLYPALNLYQADESHPLEAGSYISACTFYSIIFRKNPAAITYNFTLPATDAGNIRQVVKTQVYDSLQKWYQYLQPQVVTAAFTTTASGKTVQFNGTASVNALRYAWSFGDGGTATTATATHTYSSNGTYTVQLIITGCNNKADTLKKQLTIGSTGITAVYTEKDISVYPNPASGNVTVDCPFRPTTIMIYDAQGRLQNTNIHPEHQTAIINTSNLAPGSYFIAITNGSGPVIFKRLMVLPH